MAITKAKFNCAPLTRSVPVKVNFIPDVESDSQLTEVKWEFKDHGSNPTIATATWNGSSWDTTFTGEAHLATATFIKWADDSTYTNTSAVEMDDGEGINFGALSTLDFPLGSKELTISFWFKLTTSDDTRKPLLWKGSAINNTKGTGVIFCVFHKNGNLELKLNGSTYQPLSNPTTGDALDFNDSQWHHFALSLPAGIMGGTVFVDGVQYNNDLYLGYRDPNEGNTIEQFVFDTGLPVCSGEGAPMTNQTIIPSATEDYLGKTTDSTPDTTDDKRYVYVNTNTNFSSVTIIRPSVYGEWDVDYSYKYEPFIDYLNEGRRVWLKLVNTHESDAFGMYRVESMVMHDDYVDISVVNTDYSTNSGLIDANDDTCHIIMGLDAIDKGDETDQIQQLDAAIDEVAFFDYAVDKYKAKDLYNFGIPYDLTIPDVGGNPTYEDGLIGYFKLNENTPVNGIADSSKYPHPNGSVTGINTPSWVSGASARTAYPYEISYVYQSQAPSPNVFTPTMTVTDDTGATATYSLASNLDQFNNTQKLNLVESELAGLNNVMQEKASINPVTFPNFNDATYNDSLLTRVDGGGRAFEPLTLGNAGEVLKVNAGATGIEWGTASAGGSNISTDPTWTSNLQLAYGTGNGTGTVLDPPATGNKYLKINQTSNGPTALEWVDMQGIHVVMDELNTLTVGLGIIGFEGDGVTAEAGTFDNLAKYRITIPGTKTIADDPTWADAGDIAYATSDDAGDVLGIGTAGQVLTVNSNADAPEWANIPTPAPGTLIRDADSDTYVDVDAGAGADSDRIEMKANGNTVMSTLNGLSFRPSHGNGGYIALGKACPQNTNIYLTDVTEIGSDYLILNPSDTTNTVPSPGFGNGVAIQWKLRKLLYSYHPNMYGALQEIEIHSDTTPHEKTFTATQIPTGVTAGKWLPLPLNNFGNSLGSTDSWLGTGMNGVAGPPDAPSPSGAGDQLTVATWEPFYDMICKEFYVEMGGIGNPTDYWVNLMEYDKTVDAQTKRVTLDNGTSLTGNMTVDNVEADHVIQSSSVNQLAITFGKAYILWVGYATQTTAFPNKRVSVKWHYHYTRKA